jgi:hypothetical protein
VEGKRVVYDVFYSVWGAVLSLSVLYLTGFIYTVGTATAIPYVLLGVIAGSVVFPLLASVYFCKTWKRILYSLLITVACVMPVFYYSYDNPVISNNVALIFSFLSVSGLLFTASVYLKSSHTVKVKPVYSIFLGLENLVVVVILLSVYLMLFYRYMPLIILAPVAFEFVLLFILAVRSLLGKGRGALH